MKLLTEPLTTRRRWDTLVTTWTQGAQAGAPASSQARVWECTTTCYAEKTTVSENPKKSQKFFSSYLVYPHEDPGQVGDEEEEDDAHEDDGQIVLHPAEEEE